MELRPYWICWKGCRVFADLTAYTHPRRVAMVAALAAEQPLEPSVLRARCGISETALKRHIAKLLRRNVIAWHGDDIALVLPSTSLKTVLLALASANRMRP